MLLIPFVTIKHPVFDKFRITAQEYGRERSLGYDPVAHALQFTADVAVQLRPLKIDLIK